MPDTFCVNNVLPGCERIGEGEPERDWKVAPFSGAMVVFISRLGEGPRPNTRLPPPGGPPFKDPLARSETQCMNFKPQEYPTYLHCWHITDVNTIIPAIFAFYSFEIEFLIHLQGCI
jgi:hypothetical protein